MINYIWIYQNRQEKNIVELIEGTKRLPTIIEQDINFDKKYNNTINYLTPKDIDFINFLNRYVDKYIIANFDEKEKTEHII